MRARSLVCSVATALVLLTGAACADDQQASPPAPVEETPEASTPTRTFDPLPDPAVAAGTCALITYTPTTAAVAQKGELCRPPASAPPRDVGIVLVHGGSGTSGSYKDLRGWSEAYTDAGFTTLNIDYTLFIGGQRRTAPVFPVPEQNVKAAAQYLRGVSESIGVDPERVVVQGSSAGARIGSVAYTTPDDPWFAGPELWPEIPDHVDAFVGFYHPYDGSLQNADTYYGGDRDDADTDVRRNWAKADALLNADDASGPAAFFTGADDYALQITQQNEFADMLTAAGIVSSSTVMPGGEHGFDLAKGSLTKLGQQAAYLLLAWLDEQFPPPT